jgi:hypothetical protein
MSGSSMDGVDLAYCVFVYNMGAWNYDIKAAETMRHEEMLTTVLFVVDLGPDCYKDPTRFPSGAWCKKGDFVLVRPNSGSRLVIHGKDFRMINDDTVEGVVDDPRGIKRK